MYGNIVYRVWWCQPLILHLHVAIVIETEGDLGFRRNPRLFDSKAGPDIWDLLGRSMQLYRESNWWEHRITLNDSRDHYHRCSTALDLTNNRSRISWAGPLVSYITNARDNANKALGKFRGEDQDKGGKPDNSGNGNSGGGGGENPNNWSWEMTLITRPN